MAEQDRIRSNDNAEGTPRYVSFVLAGEDYCLDLLKVSEIVSLPEMEGAPDPPDFIVGQLRIRGKEIPVVDLKKVMGFSSGLCSRDMRIIVTESDCLELGILVDRIIHESVQDQNGFEAVPEPGNPETAFKIQTMRHAEVRKAQVLDLSNVLTGKNREILENS